MGGWAPDGSVSVLGAGSPDPGTCTADADGHAFPGHRSRLRGVAP